MLAVTLTYVALLRQLTSQASQAAAIKAAAAGGLSRLWFGTHCSTTRSRFLQIMGKGCKIDSLQLPLGDLMNPVRIGVNWHIVCEKLPAQASHTFRFIHAQHAQSHAFGVELFQPLPMPDV